MREDEIIRLWRSGIDKNKLAEIYKRSYNQDIKMIRASVRHRHDGRFITNYQALQIVERVIYNSVIMKRERSKSINTNIISKTRKEDKS